MEECEYIRYKKKQLIYNCLIIKKDMHSLARCVGWLYHIAQLLVAPKCMAVTGTGDYQVSNLS
jgi:hypothetical protein